MKLYGILRGDVHIVALFQSDTYNSDLWPLISYVVCIHLIGIFRFYYLTQSYGSVIALNIYQVQRILLFMP
jgi:uncharacterized membrane protein HdeD (DUF308 family)